MSRSTCQVLGKYLWLLLQVSCMNTPFMALGLSLHMGVLDPSEWDNGSKIL